MVLGGCEVDVGGAKSNRTMHSNYMRERGRGQKIWKERGRITRAWRYGAFIHLIRQPVTISATMLRRNTRSGPDPGAAPTGHTTRGPVAPRR